MENFFSVQNISFRYAENMPFVFENISFSLAQKEILVIIGESGAGKSSLLSILGGFFPVEKGFLAFEDKKLPSPLTQLVAGFGNIKLVTQDTKLLPNHTIFENINFPIRHFSKEKQQEKITELLGIFGLENLQNRLPRQISGGQRQRATIAQALANEPDILLLDEPFSHLDNENRYILRHILRKISAQGTSIILVTHQAQEALELGDKIAVLAQNKILQMDTPKNIYEKPISQKIALLLGNLTFLPLSHQTAYQNETQNQQKAIRPEKLQICNIAQARLKGIVKQVFFMGFFYEIQIILKENTEENIITLYFFGNIPPKINDEIGVSFEDKDLLVF